MWLVTFVDVCRLCLRLWGMVAFEMQFLLLSFHGTGRSRSISDCLFHAVQAETDAEQYEGENEGEKKLGML